MQLSVDEQREEAALHQQLEAEPRSVSAHVQLGDVWARKDQEEVAQRYYAKALNLAECQDLPSEEISDVARAERALADVQSRFHAKREALLVERGHPPEQWSPRFRHALEIAAGHRRICKQEPTDFCFPGLPTIQFFDPRNFSWAAEIEAAAPAIRNELVQELERGGHNFRPYLQSHSISVDANKALLGKKDWSILALCERNWVAPRILQRFPQTWAAVLQAPLPGIHGWGPTVVFSMLKAGAHIVRHNGMFNTRLICHLPLIVPKGCRFRVGDEVREWEEGKLLIFDDTIQHEAWNDGTEDRVVLIFDIWRPELSEIEKEELVALFSS